MLNIPNPSIPSPSLPVSDLKTSVMVREWYRFFLNIVTNLVFQAGDIKTRADAVVPFGWLLCDGSVVSQATYQALYAICGTTYNTGGEGAGNFRLPDLRGRVPIGVGTGTAPGATNHVLGASEGGETHVLTNSEMPAHNHGATTASTVAPMPQGTTSGTAVESGVRLGSNWSNTAAATDSGFTGAHSHGIASDGGGTAHTNMQPTLALNFIIKT